MSSCYVTVPPLPFQKIKALRSRWIRKPRKGTSPILVMLADGEGNCLRANCERSGFTLFGRSFPSEPEGIIAILEEMLGVHFIGEHERGFLKACRALEKARDDEALSLAAQLHARNRLRHSFLRKAFIKGLVELIAEGGVPHHQILAEIWKRKGATREFLAALRQGGEACRFFAEITERVLASPRTI